MTAPPALSKFLAPLVKVDYSALELALARLMEPRADPGGFQPGQLSVVAAGRRSGKSLAFAHMYGSATGRISAMDSLRSAPPQLTVPLDGWELRVTVGGAVDFHVRHRGGEWRKAACVGLGAARDFALALRLPDVGTATLDERTWSAGSERRPTLNEPKSRVRLRLTDGAGATLTLRGPFKRLRALSSQLEAELNRRAVAEVMDL